MTGPIRQIEEFFRQRYGKEAMFLPSGRLALYLAFREWLRPGQRLLMSPVNDDVVFFTVLAAGLIPVFAPLDPCTGNLDPDAVDEGTWGNIRAVMTTNLYGIPDQMERLVDICQQRNLLLIEDACQALDSQVRSQRIGTFSPVAVFSLSKHIQGVGGVLAFSESARRASIVSRAEAETLQRSMPAVLQDAVQPALRSLAETTRTLNVLRRAKRRFLSPKRERPGHRMEYVLEEVVDAMSAGPRLDRFDPWVGIDNSKYRTRPPASAVTSALRQLELFNENRRRRMEGTRRLLALGLTPRDLPLPEDSALFRVPLFVKDREDVLRYFAERHLALDYIYDPPLDIYAAPKLAEKITSSADAKRWSRDVLPVDPIHAERFIDLLKDLPVFASNLREATSTGQTELVSSTPCSN